MSLWDHFLHRFIGVEYKPDRARQELFSFERGQLLTVLSVSGQTPPGASWATTAALQRLALRAYDAGRIKPTHVQHCTDKEIA